MNYISASAARSLDILCRRLRAFLHKRDFVEIHSPVLIRSQRGHIDPMVGSQNGQHRLRPCMELKLRSAIASGLSAVFEIGPCFRPADLPGQFQHPEFYMLELFKRDLDFDSIVALTRDLLVAAVGKSDIEFERIDVSEWFKTTYGIDIELDDRTLREQLVERELVPNDMRDLPVYHAVNYVVGKFLERGIGTPERPALLHSFPACTVCLAARKSYRPKVIDRFEVFVRGIEVAHGFVDEMDAANLLYRMRENGAEFVDEAFTKLLESGQLPPTAGVGFGIERLMIAFFGVVSIEELLHENQFC